MIKTLSEPNEHEPVAHVALAHAQALLDMALELEESQVQLYWSIGAELRVLAESLEADLREAPDMTDEAIREVYGP